MHLLVHCIAIVFITVLVRDHHFRLVSIHTGMSAARIFAILRVGSVLLSLRRRCNVLSIFSRWGCMVDTIVGSILVVIVETLVACHSSIQLFCVQRVFDHTTILVVIRSWNIYIRRWRIANVSLYMCILCLRVHAVASTANVLHRKLLLLLLLLLLPLWCMCTV